MITDVHLFCAALPSPRCSSLKCLILQNRRDRAQMALKSRAHEILMAEMAVVVKRYRRERGRLWEANRKLLQRLTELEAQVLCVRTLFCRRTALRLGFTSFSSSFCRRFAHNLATT